MLDLSSARKMRAFRADLKALGPEWPKMLVKVNKSVAEIAATAARTKAAAGTPMQRRSARAIQARGTRTLASVSIKTARAPMANVAFWGEKRRTGWYAHLNSPDGRPQGPAWVGSSWAAGVAGEGPYAINDAVAEVVPRVVEEWGKGIDELARRAFPGK